MSSSSSDDSVHEDGEGDKEMLKVLGKRQGGVLSLSSPAAKRAKSAGSWSFLKVTQGKQGWYAGFSICSITGGVWSITEFSINRKPATGWRCWLCVNQEITKQNSEIAKRHTLFSKCVFEVRNSCLYE